MSALQKSRRGIAQPEGKKKEPRIDTNGRESDTFLRVHSRPFVVRESSCNCTILNVSNKGVKGFWFSASGCLKSFMQLSKCALWIGSTFSTLLVRRLGNHQTKMSSRQ